MAKQKPIYDCAGNVIQVDENEKYKIRCACGNLEDYYNDHKDFVINNIAEAENHTDTPALINIIIPICNSGAEVLSTIESIITSEFEDKDMKIEICFLVNCSEKMKEEDCEKNEITLDLLNYIFGKENCNEKEFCEKAKKLKVLFEKRKNIFDYLIITEKTKFGLYEIYQKGVSSYLGKLWKFTQNQLAIGKDKNETIQLVNKIKLNSTLLFLDDDILLSPDDIQKMYDACTKNNSLAIGQMNVTRVNSENKNLEEVLRIVMQCWLDFKRAFDMNTLCPRMASFQILHHAKDVNFKEVFADQQFFARMRSMVSNIYETDIQTVIGERNYPSNGNFMKRLRMYLEKDKSIDFEDLEFIQNIINVYRLKKENEIYNESDVVSFFNFVEERNIEKIIEIGNELLRRRN